PSSLMVECAKSSDKGTLSVNKGAQGTIHDKSSLGTIHDIATGSLELTTLEECRANNGIVVF
ncbi:MAG: hypothetical protein HRT35_37440, partial [Algicola sp.]|nr:hypothetical protein [Algicola sp.]